MKILTVNGKWTYSEGILSESQFDLPGNSEGATRTVYRMLTADGKWNECPQQGKNTPVVTIGCMVPKLDPSLPSKSTRTALKRESCSAL